MLSGKAAGTTYEDGHAPPATLRDSVTAARTGASLGLFFLGIHIHRWTSWAFAFSCLLEEIALISYNS